MDKGERPLQQSHIVTDVEAMEEEMFLGLRKTDGVSITLFHEKFGKSLNRCLRRNNSNLLSKRV